MKFTRRKVVIGSTIAGGALVIGSAYWPDDLMRTADNSTAIAPNAETGHGIYNVMTLEEFYKVAKRVSNWGRWGADDERGTLNLITPDVIKRAAQTVKQGKRFHLGLAYGKNGPQTGAHGSRRSNPSLFVTVSGREMGSEGAGFSFSDDLIHLPLQAATNWMAPAAAHYNDKMYNGFDADEALSEYGTTRDGIANAAAAGVVSRGVLLDIARFKGVERLAPGTEILPDDLDAASKAQGVEVESGDILMIRTGHIRWFTEDDDRKTFNESQPGLGVACADWLHDHDIAAVCADNVTVDHLPGLIEQGFNDQADELVVPLHMLCLRDMGLLKGVMFNFEELAKDCANDGVWTCMFSGTPLDIPGAVGSPLSPIAIK